MPHALQCGLNSRLRFSLFLAVFLFCFCLFVCLFFFRFSPLAQNLSFLREAKFHKQPAWKQRTQNSDKSKLRKPTIGNTLEKHVMRSTKNLQTTRFAKFTLYGQSITTRKLVQPTHASTSHSLSAWINTAVNQVFPNAKKTQLKILDAGAGTEHIGIDLLKLGHTDIHVLDISQVMLNIAKEKGVPHRWFICALTGKKFQCVT